jgi:uncharacterized protein YfaS (alpha-2-macroglobulin family)
MDAYLASHPPRTTLVDLQRALAARAWAERTPRASAAASLTVDGSTRRVDIDPELPLQLSLTPAQVAETRLAPLDGSVIVTTSWEAPQEPSAVEAAGVARFSREVKPSGRIGLESLVTVDYVVQFAAGAHTGCWMLTDVVPSGLAPVVGRPSWWGGEEENVQPAWVEPWRVDGQRVDFCATPDGPVFRFRYLARVVNAGSYRWEPALIQSTVVREAGATTPEQDLTIGTD